MIPSWNGDGEEVQEGDLHNTKTQMKLFTAIATAAVIGGSLIAAATPASAYESYRVTPTYNGGYRINSSNGYNGRYTPRYGGGGTYTFY